VDIAWGWGLGFEGWGLGVGVWGLGLLEPKSIVQFPTWLPVFVSPLLNSDHNKK